MKDANGLRLDDGDLTALAQRCVELVDQAKSERDALLDRWDRNEAFFDGVPAGSDAEMPYGLGACHHSPLTRPRIVALADHIVGIITSQRPMVRCSLLGPSDRANDVEETLQFFNDGARLKSKLKQFCIQSAIFGVAVVRPRFEAIVNESYETVDGVDPTPYGKFRTLGIAYDMINPRDFVIVNSRHCGIMSSPMVGHRFVRTRSEIEALKLEGKYLSSDLAPAIIESPDHYRQQGHEPATEQEDFIECYELYLRCLGGSEPWFKASKKSGGHWVRVVLAYDTQAVLACEPWTPSRPPYIDGRISEQIDERFWPESSVANDLQGLQIQYNQIINTVRNGSMMAAFPPILTDGAAGGSQKVTPGAIVNVNAADKSPMAVRFDPGAMTGLIELIERQADAIVGVSQAGMAIQFSGDRTATEAAAIQSGQANRLGGYIEQFGAAIEQMADYVTELLYLSYDIWSGIYGEEVELSEPADLIAPARWSTAARGSFDTPAAIIAKAQQMLELTALVGPEMLNVEELVRTIVNALELPNGDQIMPEREEYAQGEADGGMGLPVELLAMAGGAPAGPTGDDIAGALGAYSGGDL